jgi:hypothetical protein
MAIRIDRQVDPEGSFSLPQGIEELVTTMQGLERVLERQITMMSAQLDRQARYGMPGGTTKPAAAAAAGAMMQNRPQIKQSVLASVAAAGGMRTEHMTAGMTKISGVGALSSLQNLQAFTAQRVGEWIAGGSLYEGPQEEGMTPPAGPVAGVGGTGGTPVGTPSSAPAPAGAGARAAAAAAGSAPGATPAGVPAASGGTAYPGRGLGGLPGALWGGSYSAGGGAPQQALQQIGARVALSGGTSQGLGGALRSLPGVGLAMDVIDKGTGFYQNQREAGRVYQEAEGGSNLGGQVERINSLRAQLAYFGRMPEGAVSQAYGAITQMGFSRASGEEGGQPGSPLQNRTSAMNFVYQNYANNGVDVQQSTQILETASQNAAISLKSVTQAITELSDTAGKAGANAQQARQEFNSLLNQAIQMGAGPGAPGLAGAISTTQASYGKQFSDVSFSGELSANRQYMLSGQLGISPGQAQYLQRNQPGAYAQALGQQNDQMIQQIMGPELYQALQKMIQQAGGAGPDNASQIADSFLNQYQAQANIDLNVWASALSQYTGIKLTPGNVMQWIVMQVAGTGSSQAQKAASQASGQNVSASSAAAGQSGAATGQYGLAQGSSGSMGGRAGALAGPTQGPQSWQQVLTSKSGTAAKAYLSSEKKSGQRSPVLEALLQNLNQGDSVQVMTSSGARVMSLTDAMKYYPNELAAGNVQFFSGNTYLGSTASITQGLVNAGAPVTGEEAQKAGANLGQSLAAWRRQHPHVSNLPPGRSSTVGNVTVNLSNEAAQLLKLLPSNNDQAAAQSSPPANPYVASPSR